MCGLCRLPGNYLEQLYANREEYIPEEIDPNDVWAETDAEDHIHRGQE